MKNYFSLFLKDLPAQSIVEAQNRFCNAGIDHFIIRKQQVEIHQYQDEDYHRHPAGGELIAASDIFHAPTG